MTHPGLIQFNRQDLRLIRKQIIQAVEAIDQQFDDVRDENVMDFYGSFPKGGDNGAFIELQEELGTRSHCQLLVDHGEGIAIRFTFDASIEPLTSDVDFENAVREEIPSYPNVTEVNVFAHNVHTSVYEGSDTVFVQVGVEMEDASFEEFVQGSVAEIASHIDALIGVNYGV